MMTTTTTCTVCVGVADIRRDPDPDSELVTQALMNMEAMAGESDGEWTHVTLADYTGWIHSNQLEEPVVKGFCKIGENCATPMPLVAVITSTHTTLYAHAGGDDTLGTVYLSTALPLLDMTREEARRFLRGEGCPGCRFAEDQERVLPEGNRERFLGSLLDAWEG